MVSWIRERFSRWGVSCAYGWLFCFLVFPLILALTISFSKMRLASPPYEPLFHWLEEQTLQLRLAFENYWIVFSDPLYYTAYLNSLGIAAISTLCCLLLGYPMAYGITRRTRRWKVVFLILAILPFWTSFLVRVYAWMHLLSPQGLVNHALHYIGLPSVPLMHNTTAVLIGITYSYLPFMIFPLYASLEKVQRSLLEAAYDLGCRPRGAFWRITMPLSFPGILAGSSLVFIPAVGEYVIPELLGGPTSLTIGRILWYEFFTNRDWPVACALAMIMIALLLIPIFFFERLQSTLEEDSSDDI